jgi:hypothetical protein
MLCIQMIRLKIVFYSKKFNLNIDHNKKANEGAEVGFHSYPTFNPLRRFYVGSDFLPFLDFAIFLSCIPYLPVYRVTVSSSGNPL